MVNMTFGHKLLFLDIWERIKSATNINTLTQFAVFLETTQPYISRKKSQNDFPVEWAFKVAQEYGLNTDWIMTGKGSMRSGESEPEFQNELLHEIDRWLAGQIKKEPFRKEWFKGSFLDAFPLFAEWKKSQEKEEREDTSIQNKAA